MSDYGEMNVSSAEVRTSKASGYLQQLCKHFGHRLPASFDATMGCIEFPSGICELDAGYPGMLLLRVRAASAEDRARLEEVVGTHLERFAFREALAVAWEPA